MKKKPNCDIFDCSNESRALAGGLCDMHRQRLRSNGTTDLLDKWKGFTPEERFWRSVDKSGECWVWTRERNNHGYGVFRTYAEGRCFKHLAHRYSLALTGVEIEGWVARHTCDNPPCVNPAHLLLGTQKENIHDAMKRGRLDMSGLVLGQERRRSKLKREAAA